MADAQPVSLGKRLRHERELRHWTQEQLAEHIGRSVPSINRWEHDRAEPQLDALKELTALFGKPPDRWGTIRWNVPFLRNPYFTGRKQLLSSLHRTLAADKTVTLSQSRAISGLGGIGKTQTALEYAYRYAREYEAVLWVQADSQEILVSDFARLAQTLELPEKEEKDQWRIVSAVKRWLHEHSAWLLILDNADEPSVITDFLPRGMGGATLVTMRSQITGLHLKNLAVERMSREEGVTFLLQRRASSEDEEGEEDPASQMSERERQAAEELWAVMDGLPLALDQAGAYITAVQCSISEYLQRYRHHRIALLQERGGAIPEHPDAVATTWDLSFERVEQKNPAAAALLRLCAFLAPDAIPEELISGGATHLASPLQALATSAKLLDEAISTLRTYSLVQRDPATRMLSLHRLVQAVLQDKLEERQRRTWAEHAISAVNAAFPDVEYSVWPQCERLLSQALTTAQLIDQYQLVREEAGRLLHETATYLRERARYQEAEPLFLRALHIREQQLGPEHPDVAYSLHGLAALYWHQGKYTEAEPFCQRALCIQEQQLGPEHPDVATSLNSLAILYTDQGKYLEAEPLYQRALAIREKQLGPEHSSTALILNNLAIFYKDQGKYLEAEPLYQRALAIREKQLGPEHPNVAISLNNLAELYCERGNYLEAEPLYQRALRIWVQQLGPEHPETAMAMHNLAELYGDQGKYKEAEPLYQRAMAVWEKMLRPEHPFVAHALKGLANVYQKQGKYAQAEPLYQRALHIFEQQLGPEHLGTAETMHDLARYWEARGNSEEAKTLYTRALTIREQVLGVQHLKTMQTRTRLIALLHAMGRHEETARLEADLPEQDKSEEEQ